MMMKRISTRELIMSGLLIAIGVLLPMIFHTFNLLGKIFLPMHIPVLVAGYFLSPLLALVVGVVVPLLSSVLTGMPILFPMAVIMMFELGAYGACIAIFRQKFKSVYWVLIGSMVVGRLVAGLVVFVLANGFGVGLNPIIFVKGAVVTGFPGIVVQLIIVPIIIRSIKSVLK
jgi:hypothetical protein